jgi:hypothetical protein
MNNVFIRLFSIILGIVTGYVIYSKILKRTLLKNLCLSDTNSCVSIKYYSIKNSILFNMEPTGYWCWFNGVSAYLFGILTGNTCQNKDYDPAYVIDLKKSSTLPLGYECIQNLSSLIEYYSKNSREKYIYYNSKDPYQTTIYDVLNFLNNRNIIKLQ